MNPKLKIFLIRRISERGFALPVAIGLGFVLLLIAATLIMRSQGDRVTASVQKATNRGLSAAETGITRYQSLINDNRAIATYNDCAGTRNSGTCPDSSNIISWTNATKIPGITSCGGVGSATNIVSNSTTAWQDVDAGDTSKGQYRLVSYVYPAPGTAGTTGVVPGIGQLTIEGRVNQIGSSNTATQGASTATTRLQVNITVQQPNLTATPVPGVWIKSGGIGGNTIDGNVLINDCSVDLSNVNITATNSVTSLPNTKSYTSLSFPALPSKPTLPINQVLGNINSTTVLSTLGAVTISGGGSGKGGGGSKLRLTLPRGGDTANALGIYEYSVSSIDLISNSELFITPGQKVRLYLDGSISKGGDITHDCTGVSGCKPTDFQIFGSASSGTPQICTNGNNFIEAFIFAPNYSVGVAGSGGGAGGIKGTVWANSWSNGSGCGSNTSNTVVVQNAEWADIDLIPQGLPSIVGSISKWQRQETP